VRPTVDPANPAGGPSAAPDEAGSVVLEMRGIVKSYGAKTVLRGVDLVVPSHSVTVLIGPSGCGKSTLLKTINLLEQIDDGQVLLSGEDISDPAVNADAIRGRIGVVFQQFNLFPHMTVLQNVTLAARHVHKIARADAEQTGLALLERIGLADQAGAYPDRLSGGQQQRVAIVRAIATNPELLLLDEITSALDPQLVGEVLDLVLELKQQGSTIVMATHEIGFAHQVADKVVFLKDGVVADEGPPGVVLDNSPNPATRDFLARVHRA